MIILQATWTFPAKEDVSVKYFPDISEEFKLSKAKDEIQLEPEVNQSSCSDLQKEEEVEACKRLELVIERLELAILGILFSFMMLALAFILYFIVNK